MARCSAASTIHGLFTGNGAAERAPRYHRMVPAPADSPLALIQSFASTLSEDPGADPLGTRADAAAWLHAAGVLAAEAGLTNSEHAALLRMREALRDVLAAHADGRKDAAAAERLTRALAEGRLVVVVDTASTVRLASAARASYPGLVAAFAVAIADAAAAGTWPGLTS
jgi:Putative stress-induced transcription regulator